MKKIGMKITYSVALRFLFALIMAYCVVLMPDDFFTQSLQNADFEAKSYKDFYDLLQNSILSACVLSVKVILLMSGIIFVMDFIKSLNFIKNSQKNLSNFFSINIGLFLGITYGAGLLIKESENSSLKKRDIFYVGTFLMICHSIIEDTLIFVLFGANFTILVVVRLIFATIFAYVFTKIYDVFLEKYQ